MTNYFLFVFPGIFIFRPFPGIQNGLYLSEILTFVISRGINEGLHNYNVLSVPGIEGMRYERPSHKVILHVPHSAGLDKMPSAVPHIFDLRGKEVAGGHIGILKHSRDIGLKSLVAVTYDIVGSERVVLLGRVAVDEHVLIDILLLVGNPHKVGAHLAYLVAGREVQTAPEHLGNLRGNALLLKLEVVAYDPVPFSLFNGVYYDFAVLVKQFHCSLGIVGVDLKHDLGIGPDIALVHQSGRVILGIDVEDDDIAVNLEKIRKTRRSHIHQIEERLSLHQERAFVSEQGSGGIAESTLPVLPVHYHDHLSGLSADIWQKGFGVLAGYECQRTRQNKCQKILR